MDKMFLMYAAYIVNCSLSLFSGVGDQDHESTQATSVIVLLKFIALSGEIIHLKVKCRLCVLYYILAFFGWNLTDTSVTLNGGVTLILFKVIIHDTTIAFPCLGRELAID